MPYAAKAATRAGTLRHLYNTHGDTSFSDFLPSITVCVLLLNACATRQVNRPIAKYDLTSLHQVQRQWHRADPQDLVVLAFSGGGTRAAAF